LHCTVIIYTVHNIVGAYHQLKNYITLDWAVLFVLHELFLPILGHYFLIVYDISFVLDRKHALQAESYSVILLANARRSPSSLPLSTHAQTSFQPRLSRVREGSASQLANSY